MNPYLAYSTSFIIAMAVYSFGWSDAYPALSLGLFSFLFATIIIFTLFGLSWRKKLNQLINQLPLDANPVQITLFIYILWLSEFIHEGGIPLIKILLRQPFDYIHFGIPTLHVFIVTFSSFYALYLFQLYISVREKRILWLYLINLVAAFLIYNRGMLILNLAASGFLYVHHFKLIQARFFIVAPIVIIFCLFLFGVVGNIRVAHIDQVPYNNSTFLSTGNASEDFKNSIVPKEFFWSYIYISSPLANLQENINNADRHSPSWSWLLKMLNNEMLPDFVSKRINKWFNIPHPGEYRIERYFSVSTVYSISFSHQSWFGMFIMALFILAFPILYLKLFDSNNPFQAVGIAILSTMYLFMAFDNTIRFTGLSFQLFYPLALGWLEKKNWFSIRRM